eukprot:jgi/Chrzof1/15091/Cz09g26250.t1
MTCIEPYGLHFRLESGPAVEATRHCKATTSQAVRTSSGWNPPLQGYYQSGSQDQQWWEPAIARLLPVRQSGPAVEGTRHCKATTSQAVRTSSGGNPPLQGYYQSGSQDQQWRQPAIARLLPVRQSGPAVEGTRHCKATTSQAVRTSSGGNPPLQGYYQSGSQDQQWREPAIARLLPVRQSGPAVVGTRHCKATTSQAVRTRSGRNPPLQGYYQSGSQDQQWREPAIARLLPVPLWLLLMLVY